MGLGKDAWNEITLGEVCHKSSNIKWQDHTNESFKYIDLSSVSRTTLSITKTSLITSDNAPSRAKKIVLKDDVIFATTRPTLKRVTLISDDFNNQICSTGYSVLRADKDLIIPKLIYHFLQSVSFMQRMETLQRGASYPAVSDKDVMNTQLWIPKSLTEQKQIVALLDQAFKAIDQAQQNIEKNIANTKELFQSKLNAIFSQSGEGWEERSFIEITDLIDSLHKTPKYTSEGYSMVRVTDITSKFLDLSKTKKVNQETFDEFSKRHTPEIGDIIFSRVGSYGKSTLVNSIETPFCLGQNTVFIIPKINPTFLYYFLNSPNCREQIDKLKSGTTQPTVSLKSIKSIIVALPSDEEQLKYVGLLDKSFQIVENICGKYKQKLNNLEELKKSILQKAFNGELT